MTNTVNRTGREQPPAARAVRPARRGAGTGGASRFTAVYLWVAFTVIFGYLQTSLFLSPETLRLVFAQGAVTAVLALAFLIPLTTETYDLSIGSMMSMGIVLMTWFGANTDIPIALLAVCVVIFSALVGALSGFIVVRWRVNSFIATLGVSQLLSAGQLFVSQNQQISGEFSESVLWLGNGTVFGVPLLCIYLLVLALVLWFVLEQTAVGRRMFAVGGNPEAARLVGISVNRVVWGTLIASGAIAGFAGVIYSFTVGAYTSDVGQGYLFPAAAAVFFGASQFQQRPNVWGTVVAYFALAFGIQGLSLQFGAGTFWVSPLFQGLALILAVALASRQGAVGNGRDSRLLRRFRRTPPERAEDTGLPVRVSNDQGDHRATEGSGHVGS